MAGVGKPVLELEHQQRIAAGKLAVAAKQLIKQQRDAAAKFDLEFAPTRNEAFAELLELTHCYKDLPWGIDYPYHCIVDTLRGLECGFPSVQRLGP